MYLNMERDQLIIKSILRWYEKNKRDLPWRKTRNPYRILVSEIMLQQTQVDRVIPKYKAFLKQFPTVRALANASVSDVIKAWAGLGYNRRALFLQKTAKAVVEQYNGRFPKDLQLLKELPGIGDYTARAVLSFGYGEPVAMMDTNHRRFYQRVFFKGELQNDKALLVFADAFVANMKKDQVYDWNQALMDFGSLICLTSSPRCEICPLKDVCCNITMLDNKNSASSDKRFGRSLSRRHSRDRVNSRVKEKAKVPFKETDRFVRGRIIDRLREEEKVKVAVIRKLFPHIDDKRWKKIILRLAEDGLIKVVGNSMMLP